MSSMNLRVMTFNLLTSTKQKRRHPWRLRKRNIARIFEQWQPDVVGTQEANYRQLKELSDLLPGYEFLGEGNLGSSMVHSDSNWYCATFYRRDRIRPMDSTGLSEALWLSPTPEVPASQFHLGTRPRLVTWNNFEVIGSAQPFVFGTTHLEAVNSWHRQRSVAQIRQHVSQKMEEMGENIPLFLTGDFNAVSKSPEIKALVDQNRPHEPLFDAWADAHGNESPEGATFRGLGLRDRLSHALMGPRRIDYVFYRPRMEIQTVQRVDFDGLDHRESALPSDHYPVCADFQLAP